MVIIVDYGMGNLGSIKNMIKKIGGESLISSDVNEISKAKKIILPGVGAFDAGILNLQNAGLIPILNKKVIEEKIPVLGICLGMQLMTEKSEEGNQEGLKWIEAETIRFNFNNNVNLKIPHMGWNMVIKRKEHIIVKALGDEPRFYFVHSYFVKCKNTTDILLETNYGNIFTSAFQKDNIIGVQFHPEKSHKFGMNILKNFLEM